MDELWYFTCEHGSAGAVVDGVVFLLAPCAVCEAALASTEAVAA